MGVIIKIMHYLLIITAILITHLLALVKFTIPKTDVVHPKSGLILHYRSEYRPANKIVTFSVSLPMYSDMCFLIPNEAMGKIPDCEDKEATVRVIRGTQQDLQRNNNGQVQPEVEVQPGVQRDNTGSSANLSETTKSTKKSKKSVNPTIKLTTIVKSSTETTAIVNPITTPRTTFSSTTSSMTTPRNVTESWMQRIQDFFNENYGRIYIQRQGGRTNLNFTIFGPNPNFNLTTSSKVTRIIVPSKWWQDIEKFFEKEDETIYIQLYKGGLTVNYAPLKLVWDPPQPDTRSKRFAPAIIAIGVGIASTALSTVNLFLMGNLKAEIRGVKETLGGIHLATINNEAQILHLNEGQLKLAQELGNTQVALNKTMALVNQHSEILHNHAEALKTILSQTLFLRNQLDTVTHALNTHFIHESIENIMANKLNLHFIHHTDMSRVVSMVTQAMNLTTDEFNSSIPMVEIVTRLLVRQQIDFAPTTVRAASDDGVLIGKMIFTSYFAAPAQEQDPFSIYEVVPIPFNQGKRRVQLARMPAYLGLEPKSQQFIRWSKEEATTCDFEVMPACRETPVRRKEAEDDCIYQILTDTELKNCRTESFPETVFIRRVGQHWAISTTNISKCHAIPNERVDEHMVVDNEEITIPEIALITANDEKSLACDRFIIPKAPAAIDTPINLIYNESIKSSYKELINLQEILANETHWVKLPYITSDMQAVIDFISNTPKPVKTHDLRIWSEHPISFTMIMIVGALVLVITVLIFFMCGRKKKGEANNQIVIAMPSMKELAAREQVQEGATEKY